MAVSIEELGIDRLSVSERLELIDRIVDSLPEEVTPADVPPWHLAEISRRRAEAATTPGAGKPWREVLARLDDGA